MRQFSSTQLCLKLGLERSHVLLLPWLPSLALVRLQKHAWRQRCMKVGASVAEGWLLDQQLSVFGGAASEAKRRCTQNSSHSRREGAAGSGLNTIINCIRFLCCAS